MTSSCHALKSSCHDTMTSSSMSWYHDISYDWMASNRLKLNPSKTELIWLSSSRRSRHCPSGEQTIAGVRITPSLHVRNLGVMVDGELTMGTHVSHLTRTCFYHLRQLRVVRRSLTTDASHSLVRALVHSRLDYCNSVLAGLPQYSLNKLQSILRASAPDSCWSYQDRPVSPTWCGTSSIGFQCHSESSSSFVAPSSNVSMALHHPTYPSIVNRSPPSPVVISFDQLPLEIF